MVDLASALSAFHFMRPFWLLVLPAVAVLWWLVRKSEQSGVALPANIAPHLANALTLSEASQRRLKPVDSTALILCLLALAAAGPAWSRIPNPLLADTAPVVVVLKVTGSMQQSDVAPTRLERAKQKIQDLLAERSGARTALVAYAGTAHRVVPLTEDPAVIKPFLEGLSPEVMPAEGNNLAAALSLADDILAPESGAGSVLVLLDAPPDTGSNGVSKDSQRAFSLQFWFMGRDEAAYEAMTAFPGSQSTKVTVDGRDVTQVLRTIDTDYQAALAQDETQKWKDEGWILVWPAAALLLFWFRRGWTMQWAICLVAIPLALTTTQAHAEGWRDWFFTPDQQGRIAFEAKDYEKASELFDDPMWKAYSLYRLGRYEEAAELYAWQDGADAAIGEGMSLIRSRSYRGAIDAFAKAVERDPQNAAAQHNLELARYILDYVETTREQSDTGEDRGIGADDVVFDNESGKGADSQQIQSTEGNLPETAEQWMRTVDTRTGDFLKTRFTLEAARRAQ